MYRNKILHHRFNWSMIFLIKHQLDRTYSIKVIYIKLNRLLELNIINNEFYEIKLKFIVNLN